MKCWSVKCLIMLSPWKAALHYLHFFCHCHIWNGSINLFFFYSRPLTFFTFYHNVIISCCLPGSLKLSCLLFNFSSRLLFINENVNQFSQRLPLHPIYIFLFLFGFCLQNVHLWWKHWHKCFINRISTADSKFKQAPYYR